MKKKFLFLVVTAVAMVGCKSYSLMESTPSVDLAKKLPALEVGIDEGSFATITGYESTVTNGSSYVDYSTSTNWAYGSTSSKSVSYASTDLNNLKSLYFANMYDNIISKVGEKKGKVVCRLVTGDSDKNIGFTILSACTLCIPNLFGMPFISATTNMMVEMDFMDMNNNVVASYKSKPHKVKKYAALYWGYDDCEGVSIAETFKQCLDDVNKQIKGDYENLEAIYSK